MPGNLLNTFHALTHRILSDAIRMVLLSSHSKDVETEAMRDRDPCVPGFETEASDYFDFELNYWFLKLNFIIFRTKPYGHKIPLICRDLII